MHMLVLGDSVGRLEVDGLGEDRRGGREESSPS